MKIRVIKKKADNIYIRNRKMIIPEFFFIGYMSLLAQYLHSGLFSFFVSLFLCPIAHGYVYCSMKLVDNENASIDYHDSMIGIIDFTRVAPTYLIRKGMILLITLICALPSLYSLLQYIPFLSIEWFASLGNAFIQTEFFVPDFYDIPQLTQNGLVMINLLLCIFVYLFLTALLMPMPYIMEKDEFSWSECLITSLKGMNNHIIDYFKLYFIYALRHALYWLLTGTVIMIIGSVNSIWMLLWMVASLFIYIELYRGRFEIAKYLFYEEIRKQYEKKYRRD